MALKSFKTSRSPMVGYMHRQEEARKLMLSQEKSDPSWGAKKSWERHQSRLGPNSYYIREKTTFQGEQVTRIRYGYVRDGWPIEKAMIDRD